MHEAQFNDIEDIFTFEPSTKTKTTHDKHEKTRKFQSIEEILIQLINKISGIFDYLYFFKSIGLLSENNFLYRKLNKGNWGSKFWSLSLFVNIKRSLLNCWKLFKYKIKLSLYIQNYSQSNNPSSSSSSSSVNDIILNKLKLKLSKINNIFKEQLFELAQNSIYFTISIIDIFTLNINPLHTAKNEKWIKMKNHLETIANILTIYRFSSHGYNLFKMI